MPVQDVKKLPFANYDVVVYLGIGMLSIPFVVQSIVIPLGFNIPLNRQLFQTGFVNTTVETLIVIFGGYLIGHIVAFVSSYLVEGFIHRFMGYPSHNWIRIVDNEGRETHKIFSDNIRQFVSRSTWKKYWLRPSSLGIIIFNFPAFPAYSIIYMLKAFDFYKPKISIELFSVFNEKYNELRIDVPLNTTASWVKIVEHCVSNNMPSGYVRFYNYMMIYGALRSMALLAHFYLWSFILGRIFDANYENNGAITQIFFHPEIDAHHVIQYLAILSLIGIMMMAFAKFNRRAFEECIYCFCCADLSKVNTAKSSGTPPA
jgi:hypothetical protein